MKIRKWDKVQVISWKQKDKWVVSEVLKVLKDKNKVLVKDINIVTKHLKKTATTPGQIVKMEKPIDISNVLLVCPFTNKPTRIWYVFVQDKKWEKKFRYSKRAVKDLGWEAAKYIIK